MRAFLLVEDNEPKLGKRVAEILSLPFCPLLLFHPNFQFLLLHDLEIKPIAQLSLFPNIIFVNKKICHIGCRIRYRRRSITEHSIAKSKRTRYRHDKLS